MLRTRHSATEAEYDVTFVEYEKRLAEMFDEELPQIFKWTERHRRKTVVDEFEGRSLRPWIRQFWWLEVPQIPPRNVIEFHQWPPAVGAAKPAHFYAKFAQGQNRIMIIAVPGSDVTLWLSPEMVNFSKRVTIQHNSDRNVDVQPSRSVLLEDVRQRADRKHPYWARLDFQKNNWVAQ